MACWMKCFVEPDEMALGVLFDLRVGSGLSSLL